MEAICDLLLRACRVLSSQPNFARKATACLHSFIPTCADCVVVGMVIIMKDVKVIYCIDGYHDIEISINSIDELLSSLQKIKSEASSIIKCIFSADVMVEGAGRISIGLDEKCILTYTSEDFEKTLTSLGDEVAQGDTMYYFGDYTPMSNKYVIPYEDAIEALKVWVTKGELSTNIRWTDKLF